jgi:hypothetical protein
VVLNQATWVDHKVVLIAVPAAWVIKARAPAEHKVDPSLVTWAEVLVRVWTVVTLDAAAAQVLVTQALAEANVDRAACSPLDCFAINLSSLVSLQGLIISYQTK